MRTPALWVLRESAATGTKVRLRHGAVRHLHRAPGRQARRSCSTPLSAASKSVTTIEGVGASRTGKAVQAAWAQGRRAAVRPCQSSQIAERLRACWPKNKARWTPTSTPPWRQHLPLRHLQPDPRGHPRRVGGDAGDAPPPRPPSGASRRLFLKCQRARPAARLRAASRSWTGALAGREHRPPSAPTAAHHGSQRRLASP